MQLIQFYVYFNHDLHIKLHYLYRFYSGIRTCTSANRWPAKGKVRGANLRCGKMRGTVWGRLWLVGG